MKHFSRSIPKVLTITLSFAVVLSTFAVLQGRTSAACQAPAADYGSASITISVPSTATYRLWTRMMAGDANSTTFAMEVDGNTCYNVGAGSLSSSAWTWVDYQNGNTASKTQLSLTQGTHTIKLIGTLAGVKVDRVIAASDLNCVPTNASGSECNTPNDTTVPTVSITAPAASATVSGQVDVTANASDNTQVAKVEFYVNSQLVGSDTTAPYAYKWDTTLSPNNTYTLLAKAYDSTGNTASDTRSVAVKNNDIVSPSAPSNLTATAGAGKVDLKWSASTDNVGVVGYQVTRNGSPLIRLSAVTSYTDSGVTANTSYTYQLTALDAAGNVSAPSAVVTAKTPNPNDAQAPSRPTNLTATAVSSSQINLKWSASTDNVSVAGYQVFRQSGISPAQKIATVTTTTFGDTTLKASTSYTYHVKAVDAAGNVSERSSLQTVTTHGTVKGSELLGTIRDVNGRGIPYSKVSFAIDGKLRTYTADSQGKYYVDGVPGGSYVMTFEATGYRPETISRPVRENARVAQNATLQRQ
jgi:chitodextrinase